MVGAIHDEALYPNRETAVQTQAAHKVMYKGQSWPCLKLLLHSCYQHTTSDRQNGRVEYWNEGEWIVDRKAPWPVRWSDRALKTANW